MFFFMLAFASSGVALYDKGHYVLAIICGLIAVGCYAIDSYDFCEAEVQQVECLPGVVVDGMREIIDEMRERIDGDDRGATRQELVEWERRITDMLREEID